MKIFNTIALSLIFISLFSCEPEKLPTNSTSDKMVLDSLSIDTTNTHNPYSDTGDQDDEVEKRGEE